MNYEANEEKSKTLCLVRLRAHFRFDYSKEGEIRRIYSNQMRGAFASRQAAQDFIQSNAPVDVNPFNVPYGFYIEQDEITLYHDEVEDDGFDDGYILKSVGMLDADGEDEKVEGFIQDRADETKTTFTEFVSLCQQVGIAPPNLPPYSPMVLWDKEQLRRENVKVLLRRWWEDQKNTMTSEQKAAIWRALHPRPYEIVQVPWER